MVASLCADSQKLLKNMSPEFQQNLQKCISLIQGSVFYIQQGAMGNFSEEARNVINSIPNVQQELEKEDVDLQKFIASKGNPLFKEYMRKSFTSNCDNVFFWSYDNIWYINIRGDLEFKKLNF